MMKNLTVILCGDLCPTQDTLTNFLKNDKDELLGDVNDVLATGDIVFGNLEYVLTDHPTPIKKAGPILHAETKSIDVLKDAGFNIFSLANNHIKDCGEAGVRSTIETCKSRGINYFGAGENLNQAKKPYIIDKNGYKIGFISFAEQEFNIASETSYGSSFFDPYEDLDAIENLKKVVDYLIVIYHGGIEYYEYPSPLLQKKCRKFVDKGGDLVLCQHSHCIGTLEEYSDKTILYGQGNTLFGYKPNNLSWNQGLIVKLTFSDENAPNLELIPVTAHERGGIELLDIPKAKSLLDEMYERSKNVYDKSFIQKSWEKFVSKQSKSYLPFLFGFNRYLIHVNRFTNNFIVRVLYGKRAFMVVQNIIRCEAHYEVVQTSLKIK